jgi:guanylate kinase
MTKCFPELYFSVSYTTRPRRPGDQEGRDYHFISPEEFQGMIDRGEFAEWAQIYGQRYGTSRILLEAVESQGRDIILDIDGQGARQLRDHGLPGVFIFILPPSMGELKKRLTRRRTEGRGALEERLYQARTEMAEARWYDYLILNDELEKTLERVRAVILAEHCRRQRNEEALDDLLQEKVVP